MSNQRIDAIRPGEAEDEEINEMLEQAAQFNGDGTAMGILAHKPEILKGFWQFVGAWWEEGEIEPHIKELMRLKSAEINRCTYCATVRLAGTQDDVGPKEDAVFGDVDASDLTRREALAVEFAEQMAGDPNYITDEFFDELREEFTDEEIVELIVTEGVALIGHLIVITTRADISEESRFPTGLEYPMEDPKAQAPPQDD